MDSLVHARLCISGWAGSMTWEERKAEIEDRFSLRPFVNDQILILALTHFSFGLKTLEKEFKALARHGDKVIYYYLSRKLLQMDFEDRTQSFDLTRLLASNATLDECGMRMGLQEYVLHEGTKTGVRPKQKHIADAFEALVGAIDVEHKVDEASRFLDNWLWSQKDTLPQLEVTERLERQLTPDEQRWEELRRVCARAGLPEPQIILNKRENWYVAHVWAGHVSKTSQAVYEPRARLRAVRALIGAVLKMP